MVTKGKDSTKIYIGKLQWKRLFYYIYISVRIFYFILKLNILIGYHIFTFFKLTRISVFPNIRHLFISRISIDPIPKICLPIMLGAKKQFGQKVFKRQHPFFKRKYFVANIFFSKKTFTKKIRY